VTRRPVISRQHVLRSRAGPEYLAAMNPLAMAAMVFVGCFGGALGGILLGARLPAHHLDAESKDVIRVSMGLVATMTALILGLVTASAKSSYDAADAAVKEVATDILVLDGLLGRYGDEAAEIRALMKRTLARQVDSIWTAPPAATSAPAAQPISDRIQDRILALAPRDDARRWLKAEALSISEDALKTRWLSFSGTGHSVSPPFLGILLFWLTAIFWSFGLFSPRTATVAASLFVCALSIAGAVFLILEMDDPFFGLMRVSDAPLRYTLAHIGG
jgi:hypothetical protein